MTTTPGAHALDSEEFFHLVESLLLPPMAALGYHAIHGSVDDEAELSVPHTAGEAVTPTRGRLFSYGFEAGTDEVCRLVMPDDPLSADEWWLDYVPATGQLELRDWEPVAGTRVDWDIWLDHGPCSPAQVRRRLADLGRAVTAFVAEQGGRPIRG